MVATFVCLSQFLFVHVCLRMSKVFLSKKKGAYSQAFIIMTRLVIVDDVPLVRSVSKKCTFPQLTPFEGP